MLAGEGHVGMAHPVVSGEGICSAESLFFGAKIAADLLFASIVDGIFVPGEIIRSREDCVALLPGAGVNSVASMRSCLAT
jgi:hypothetical protein